MASEAVLIRKEMAANMRKFAEVLEENVPGLDAGALRRAAHSCEEPTAHGRSTWGYEITSLKFPGFRPSGRVRPRLADAGEAYVEIGLSITGECNRFREECVDPLLALAVNILVWGEDGTEELITAWHLDRHLGNSTDDSESDHPRYHFQFGGRRMWQAVTNYGQVMVPEAPRLAHPPLDGILAVHFVLANFFGNIWMSLMENREYEKLVVDAQEMLWRPYVGALASSWMPGPFDTKPWPADEVWPLLIDSYSPV